MKNEYTPEFELAWEAFPKRAGTNPKTTAFRAYNAAVKHFVGGHEALLKSIKDYALNVADRVGTTYLPMMSTWINQRRWEELIEKPQTSAREVPPLELTGWRLSLWKAIGSIKYEAWIQKAIVTKNVDTVTFLYPSKWTADFAKDRYGHEITAAIKNFDPTVRSVIFRHSGAGKYEGHSAAI